MYELKMISKCSGIIDYKISSHNDEKLIVRNCCEKGGLLLIKGLCYGSPVAIDANGDRFALLIRKNNSTTWVEYTKLRKNQKLELGEE